MLSIPSRLRFPSSSSSLFFFMMSTRKCQLTTRKPRAKENAFRPALTHCRQKNSNCDYDFSLPWGSEKAKGITRRKKMKKKSHATHNDEKWETFKMSWKMKMEKGRRDRARESRDKEEEKRSDGSKKKGKKKRRNLGREWQAAAKHLAATRLSDWRQIKKWIKDSSLSHAWTPAFHEAMAPELYKPQCVTKTSISNNAVIVAALQLLQTFLVAPSGSDSRDWHDAISFFFFFFFFVVCTLPAHGRSAQTRD